MTTNAVALDGASQTAIGCPSMNRLIFQLSISFLSLDFSLILLSFFLSINSVDKNQLGDFASQALSFFGMAASEGSQEL